MGYDCETLVVGAGVVGLAAARRLALAGQAVVVLERNHRIGAEVSSRSSEVLHAGLYYAPGSLKARLCVAGRMALYRFAEESGVAVRRVGKILVAQNEREVAALDAIAATAHANGIDSLVRLTAAEARALEPELRCTAALLSPETGVIDCHGFLQALEGHAANAGATIQLATDVTALRSDPQGFTVDMTSSGTAARIRARRLVLAAGLAATSLGRKLTYRDGYTVPETFYAKGHYFTPSARPPFSHLIYPVPRDGGLGIHLTIDVHGAAKFGPDIAWCETIDYAFDDENGLRRAAFERTVRQYWPSLPDTSLQPAFAGIRPKITRAGEPAADFAIHGEREHGVAGLLALYGIDSPGLTASLAIADHVAELLR